MFKFNRAFIHTFQDLESKYLGFLGLQFHKCASCSSEQKPKILSVSEQLKARIEVRGPLTVADYMKAVLTNPMGGYYMERNVLGHQGDFITSPEISHLFGEMVGVWFVNEVQKLLPPSEPLQLVELGPGYGTLIKDVFQVFKKFRGEKGVSLHLVEMSPVLSRIQAEKLCVLDSIQGKNLLTFQEENNQGKPSNERQYKTERHNEGGKGMSIVTVGRRKGIHQNNATGLPHYQKGLMEDGTQVYWYYSLNDVPKKFSCFLAHEFFDALPIHKFKKTPQGWREILITSDEDKGSDHFKYIISRSETPSSKMYMKFSDERDEVEFCPEGGLIAQQLASRLEENGGISLVIDYGHEGENTDTFRAFCQHKQVDPLVSPGTADLTADVDFSYLRNSVIEKTVTYGPISQSTFLKNIGIDARVQALKESNPKISEDQLMSEYSMLMHSMGERFKFFAIFPNIVKEHLEKFPVAGFSSHEHQRKLHEN